MWRRGGKWVESLAAFRKAQQLDPKFSRNTQDMRQLLKAGRRYEEYLKEDPSPTAYARAQVHFWRTGSTAELEAWLAALKPEERTLPANLTRQRYLTQMRDDNAKPIQADESILSKVGDGDITGNRVGWAIVGRGVQLAVSGNPQAGRASLESLRGALRSKPKLNRAAILGSRQTCDQEKA